MKCLCEFKINPYWPWPSPKESFESNFVDTYRGWKNGTEFIRDVHWSVCYGPKVTKYQRCNFIIQIHQFTIKIDKININLLFECVKIVEFNFNSHVFHVMYQETRFLNQDACFLNQEGRRQFLISFVSEGDWNRKICHAPWTTPWRIPPIPAHSRPPALDMAEEGIEELVRRIIRAAQGINTSRTHLKRVNTWRRPEAAI